MKTSSILSIYAFVIVIGAVVGWLILKNPTGVAIGAAIVEGKRRAGRS